MRKSTKKKIMGIIISLAFLASIITGALNFVFPTEEQQETWASRISVYIFGQLQTIPAGTGIVDQTRGKLFTINYDNIIYKEVAEDATLREFFEIWGENFNSTCILDHCNEGNYSMKMYVNGVESRDYELYTIRNGDDIVIDYR